MSDIEPAGPRGNVTKRAAAKSASPGRGVSRSAASGRYVQEKAAARKHGAALSGMKSKAPKKVYERVVELGYEKPRRKRSREENEKLVEAAKALVIELREDQKVLPNGI